MLGEFNQTIASCSEILAKQRQITTGAAVDDIDLTTLDIAATEIASNAYTPKANRSAAEIIAFQEAYDYVSGHKRLNTCFSRDRAHYYAVADAELEKDETLVTTLSGVLDGYARFHS